MPDKQLNPGEAGPAPSGQVLTNVEAGGLRKVEGINQEHLPSTVEYGKVGEGVRPPCISCKLGHPHEHEG